MPEVMSQQKEAELLNSVKGSFVQGTEGVRTLAKRIGMSTSTFIRRIEELGWVRKHVNKGGRP